MKPLMGMMDLVGSNPDPMKIRVVYYDALGSSYNDYLKYRSMADFCARHGDEQGASYYAARALQAQQSVHQVMLGPKQRKELKLDAKKPVLGKKG